MVVSSIIAPTFVRADDFQKKIEALEQQKAQDSQNSAVLSGQATDIQSQINDLATQIASIQSQIDINTSRSDDLTNQIEAA